MPAFGSELVEDLTKRAPPIDFLLSYAAISCAVTVLAVAALANAINIIDGFNGLASMVAFMMFASLAYVAFQVSEPIALSASFMMMGAVLGFFIWNFPAGLIFLGDGGANFIGFMLQQALAVLREHRVVPPGALNRKPDEPAEQQVVAHLLHEHALAAHRVEHLQQQRPHQLLGRNRGTAGDRVDDAE